MEHIFTINNGPKKILNRTNGFIIILTSLTNLELRTKSCDLITILDFKRLSNDIYCL